MAYSSVLTVCGAKSIYLAENNWVSYIPFALTLTILYILIRNHRGMRTYVAIAIALVASAILLLVHQLILPPNLYNLGTLLLFLAIWLNGSLVFFVNTLNAWIKERKSLWHS